MDSSPEIDLHTFAPKDISSVVEEYVRDAHGHGLRLVRLVHGRGRGVQRGIVQAPWNGIRSSSNSGTTPTRISARRWRVSRLRTHPGIPFAPQMSRIAEIRD